MAKGLRRRRTPEQAAAWAEYQRRYRATHKDKVRQWRENYIRNKARRLLAEDDHGAADEGGDGA